MDELLQVPEFAMFLAQHLDYSSLVSCVQVSRMWHQKLIPQLWRTFGQSPSSLPIRFGPQSPPVSVRSGARLFTISEPASSSFSFASATMNFTRQDNPTVWQSLFRGHPLSAEDAAIIEAIVAKHAHYIRCLVVHSLDGLRIFQRHCTQLTALMFVHLRLSDCPAEIVDFVMQQPNLEAVSIPQSILPKSDILRQWILSRSMYWKHVDVLLEEQDYLDIRTRFPNVRSAGFHIQSLETISTAAKLSPPNPQLIELELWTWSFDSRAFQAILTSFPNLRRLVVETLDKENHLNDFNLNLVRGNEGSMLHIEMFDQDEEVSQMIPLLPDLVLIDYCYMDASTFRALAHFSLLLWSCRELVHVNCPDRSVHVRDIMAAPWICGALRHLRCQFEGVPRKLTLDEAKQYQDLMDRGGQAVSAEEQRIISAVALRERCEQAIKDQVAQMPSLILDPLCKFSLQY
ncbi:hypothetical protein BGZ73_007177 [Actinomortierella ambigua]|nr:hypothetical protein BGZ73_007177 [Actinomortierella ambigua]